MMGGSFHLISELIRKMGKRQTENRRSRSNQGSFNDLDREKHSTIALGTPRF